MTPRRKRATILIADVQPDIRKLIRMTLECEPSYDIVEASDGATAWTQLCTHRPHVFIVDVKMPSISGLDLCRMIRSSADLEHTSVIMISAQAQRSDIEQGIKVGCDRYMTKPFSAVELYNTVDLLIDK